MVVYLNVQEDGVDITANSLHPGAIVTNLFRHNSIVSGKHFASNLRGSTVFKELYMPCSFMYLLTYTPRILN